MGYIEKNLVSGENVLYRARLHWSRLLKPALIMVICAAVGGWLIYWLEEPGRPKDVDWLYWVAIVLIASGVAVLFAGIIARRAAEFAVTNKRVILKTGVMHQRTQELFLNKIESIDVDQTTMGRVFGYGSIRVIGTGGSAEPFHNISKPLQFRHQVQEQIGQLSTR